MQPRFLFTGRVISWMTILFFSAVFPAQAATRLFNATDFVPAPDAFTSAMVMVPRTHQVLYALQAEQPHAAASLTKLPAALAVVRRPIAWDRLVTMRAADEVGGGRLRVRVGSQLTMRDLMYCSITASANNSAMALARLSGVNRKNFLALMNQEAKRAGATASHFVEPSGMDPKNMTTAHDMALIAERAFKVPLIQRAASTATYQFTVRKPRVAKAIKNTNNLLTVDPDVWVIGGKTGYLEESRHNLVVQMRPLAEDGTSAKEKELIVVVLGAATKEGMFTAAKQLAEWAWGAYTF